MKTLLIVIAVVLVVVLAAGVVGSRDDRHPGSPTVYAKIDATTDCGELQYMFDLADEHHGTARNHAQREYTLAYMKAADRRMREVGCYG